MRDYGLLCIGIFLSYLFIGPKGAAAALIVGIVLLILSHFRNKHKPSPEIRAQEDKTPPDIWYQTEGQFQAVESPKTLLGHRLQGSLLNDRRFIVIGNTPERQKDFESIAVLAASRLFAFPSIRERLSDEVKNAPEGYERWLYFLKQQGELQYLENSSPPWEGVIPDLVQVSVQQCRVCRSWVPEL